VGVAKWDGRKCARLHAYLQVRNSSNSYCAEPIAAALISLYLRAERQLPRFDGVRFRDLILSAAGIVLLMALIALADDRVRERIGGVTPRGVSHTVSEGTTRAEWATLSLRDFAMENGPLAMMVVAGAVLFVCMFRT
jgi:hypothetical protein